MVTLKFLSGLSSHKKGLQSLGLTQIAHMEVVVCWGGGGGRCHHLHPNSFIQVLNLHAFHRLFACRSISKMSKNQKQANKQKIEKKRSYDSFHEKISHFTLHLHFQSY